MKNTPFRNAALILLFLGGSLWVAGLAVTVFTPTTYRATATISYGEPITENESRALNLGLEEILKVPEGIEITHLRMSNIVAVNGLASEGTEAADMANASAQTIIERAHQKDFTSFRILDDAEVPYRPISPNIPLVLATCGGSGAFFILTGGILFVVHTVGRRNREG